MSSVSLLLSKFSYIFHCLPTWNELHASSLCPVQNSLMILQDFFPVTAYHELSSGSNPTSKQRELIWRSLVQLFRLLIGLRRVVMNPCFIHGYEITQKLIRIAVEKRNSTYNVIAFMVNYEQRQHPPCRYLSHVQVDI